MRLKEFFYDPDKERDNTEEPNRFKEKSTWTPKKNRYSALETYVTAVKEDTWKLVRRTRAMKDNLTPEERDALK